MGCFGCPQSGGQVGILSLYRHRLGSLAQGEAVQPGFRRALRISKLETLLTKANWLQKDVAFQRNK